jgi:hypothetical protein
MIAASNRATVDRALRERHLPVRAPVLQCQHRAFGPHQHDRLAGKAGGECRHRSWLVRPCNRIPVLPDARRSCEGPTAAWAPLIPAHPATPSSRQPMVQGSARSSRAAATILTSAGFTSSHLRVFKPQSGLIQSCASARRKRASLSRSVISPISGTRGE